MPPPSIAFDLTRLITRIPHANPTGIDRVDLAYARRYLTGEGPRFGLVSGPFGPRIVPRGTALGIVEAVAAGWVEAVRAEDDPVYGGLAARLGAPLDARLAGPPRRGPERMRRRRLQVAIAGRTLSARGSDSLPAGTIYLHTSHLRLDRPGRFDWLYERRDVQPVFFVHDLIPIARPEYGRRGEAVRHMLRMRTIARHARHVLVNSDEVGVDVRAHFARHGFGPRPVTAAWLGVEPIFTAREAEPPRYTRPVFVVCGTIETRKNHMLLLNLWRDLSERHGPEAPLLVIVGRRGWEAHNVFAMLERCEAIRDTVIEVGGLGTPGLARLMRGATALLMPSFAEGYGLPVVEAAASGLPFVASDIPVHREIGGAAGYYLDPLDGAGWRTAIEALSLPGSRLHGDLTDRIARFVPPTWEKHFERVDAVLDGLAAPDAI